MCGPVSQLLTGSLLLIKREVIENTHHGVLYVFGEDMSKWNGKSITTLEACVPELQGKTITNEGSSRKLVVQAPVNSSPGRVEGLIFLQIIMKGILICF